jgi:hypothetical protein
MSFDRGDRVTGMPGFGTVVEPTNRAGNVGVYWDSGRLSTVEWPQAKLLARAAPGVDEGQVERAAMSFEERFPGLREVEDNIDRWPKKPHRGDRYLLREQRELLSYLFWLARANWNRPAADTGDQGLREALTNLTDQVSRYLLADHPDWLAAGTPAQILSHANVVARAALNTAGESRRDPDAPMFREPELDSSLGGDE